MTEELKPPVSRVLPILSAAELVPEPPLHGAVAKAWGLRMSARQMAEAQSVDDGSAQIPNEQLHKLPPSHSLYQPKE